MLRRLLGSGDGVEVIVGAAGTGKTTLLAAPHHAWQQAGLRVHGAALAALAAGQLQTGSGIAATTLHRLLDDLARPESAGLGSNDVIVIDEAAMLGSRTLAALAERASRAGAKNWCWSATTASCPRSTRAAASPCWPNDSVPDS